MSRSCLSVRTGVARCVARAGLSSLLVVCAAVSTPAGEAAPAAPTPVAAVVAAPTPAPDDLGQALRAVIDESRARVRALHAAAKAADDPQQSAAILAEVTDIRDRMQRRLLGVQLDFATRKGDAMLVAELAGILDRMDRPAAGVPQDRPAPQPNPLSAPAAR